MPDQRPTLVVVPTELERRNPFYDLAALAFVVIMVKYLSQFGLHWWALPLVLAVAAWTLSGEPATDVVFVGAIASGVRSKLGLRRAHEWLLAYLHYVVVAVWPRWKEQCQNSTTTLALLLRSRSRSSNRTINILVKLRYASGVLLNSRRLRFWSRP